MRTYLVTGGAGFIGSNFIHYLMNSCHEDNIRVINLDALTYSGNRNNTIIYEGCDNYRFIKGNICDEFLVKKIFEGYDIDYVVHFAAETHVDRSIEAAGVFAETNVIGTLNLLNIAKDNWIHNNINERRFLYVSTDEVYGELCSEGYFTEHSSIKPRNPYSASKAAGEMLAYSYYTTFGLPVLITRSSNNYGPYQNQEKFIPHCIKACLTDKVIPLYGDGLHIRDWLYVKDNCSAIYKTIQHGKTGEVYNIGCHNEQTNIDIAKTIIDVLAADYGFHDLAIKHVEDRKGHDRRYAIEPSKIIKELGWHYETDFPDGIQKTIHWYMENKDRLA